MAYPYDHREGAGRVRSRAYGLGLLALVLAAMAVYVASNYLFADSIVDPGSTGSVKCAAVVDSPSNPAFQAELRGSGTDRAAICAQQRIHRLTVGAGWVVVATVLGGAGVCLMRRGDSAT